MSKIRDLLSPNPMYHQDNTDHRQLGLPLGFRSADAARIIYSPSKAPIGRPILSSQAIEGTSKRSKFSSRKLASRSPCKNTNRLLSHETFDNGKMNGWRQARTEKAGDFGWILGRFGHLGKPYKIYNVPRSASMIRLEFDFVEIDWLVLLLSAPIVYGVYSKHETKLTNRCFLS